jgi:hypothetical protein
MKLVIPNLHRQLIAKNAWLQKFHRHLPRPWLCRRQSQIWRILPCNRKGTRQELPTQIFVFWTKGRTVRVLRVVQLKVRPFPLWHISLTNNIAAEGVVTRSAAKRKASDHVETAAAGTSKGQGEIHEQVTK